MPRYQIRSRILLDLVNEIKSGRLVLSPYFQRDLVWRKTHKQDFITTILLGYPFPQIFISRGTIDVERMLTTSVVVDGQQRMSTIREFVDNKLDVSGRTFKHFSPEEKEVYLKYEIPVIELDLADNDPRLKEIFQRLNRTFYSLTEIEKLSTEYSTSEFMLVAKLITSLLESPRLGRELQELAYDAGDEIDELDESPRPHVDPNIPPTFWEWADTRQVGNFQKLLLETGVFTSYEISRQVHLIFMLNLLSTIVGESFFSRNSRTREFLDYYKESVPNKDEIVRRLEHVAGFIGQMEIPARSYWNNKANIFSIIVSLYRNERRLADCIPQELRQALDEFARDLPGDYQLAAKEAVNRKRERVIRNRHLQRILFHEEDVDDEDSVPVSI